MKILKTIFGHTGSRVWFIVTTSVIALLLVVSILMSTVFFSVFVSILGGRRAVFSSGDVQVYQSDYDSKEETLEAANGLYE